MSDTGESKNEPLSTRVTPSFKERVREFGEERGETQSDAVREALTVGMEILDDGRDPDALEERIQELEDENQQLRERIEDLRNTPRHTRYKQTAAQLAGVAVLGLALFFGLIVLDPQLGDGNGPQIVGQLTLFLILTGAGGSVFMGILSVATWVWDTDNVRGSIKARITGGLDEFKRVL